MSRAASVLISVLLAAPLLGVGFSRSQSSSVLEARLNRTQVNFAVDILSIYLDAWSESDEVIAVRSERILLSEGVSDRALSTAIDRAIRQNTDEQQATALKRFGPDLVSRRAEKLRVEVESEKSAMEYADSRLPRETSHEYNEETNRAIERNNRLISQELALSEKEAVLGYYEYLLEELEKLD